MNPSTTDNGNSRPYAVAGLNPLDTDHSTIGHPSEHTEMEARAADNAQELSALAALQPRVHQVMISAPSRESRASTLQINRTLVPRPMNLSKDAGLPIYLPPAPSDHHALRIDDSSNTRGLVA